MLVGIRIHNNPALPGKVGSGCLEYNSLFLSHPIGNTEKELINSFHTPHKAVGSNAGEKQWQKNLLEASRAARTHAFVAAETTLVQTPPFC